MLKYTYNKYLYLYFSKTCSTCFKYPFQFYKMVETCHALLLVNEISAHERILFLTPWVRTE